MSKVVCTNRISLGEVSNPQKDFDNFISYRLLLDNFPLECLKGPDFDQTSQGHIGANDRTSKKYTISTRK